MKAIKTEGWGPRLLLLLVLCIVGVSASTSPWHLGLLLGLAVGTLAIVIETRFVRLPMVDAVYMLVGAATGIGLGLLVMLLLRLGNVRLGAVGGIDPFLLIPLALGYAFAQVAFAKVPRAPGVPGRETVAPSHAARATATLVDMSSIIDGRVADLVLVGLLSGPFVVPASVKPALETLMKSKDMVQRGRARRGLETLERLEEAAGKSGGVEYRDFGDPEKETFRILDWLRREHASLVSSEVTMLDTAAREGNKVIRLDEVGAAARAVVLPGERVHVKPVRRGRNQGQAVGYLNDGTMIVVEDGEEFLGKMVEAVAHTTFRASGGTMVFSRIASQPEEDLRESVPEPAAAGTGDDEAD